MLACLDSVSFCDWVVENGLCDETEHGIFGTTNLKQLCKKTCGHCGKLPTNTYDLCMIHHQTPILNNIYWIFEFQIMLLKFN